MALGNIVDGAVQTGTSQLSQVQAFMSGQPNSLSNYISEQTGFSFLAPTGAKGINGFVFDQYDDDSIDIETEVTDHFAEDNSFIQDMAAIHPIECTLTGFVGEIAIPAPNAGAGGLFQSLESKLGTVDAFGGKYTPGGLQKQINAINGSLQSAQNYVNQVSQYLNQAQTLLKMFSSGAGKTKQQKAFASLATLVNSKIPCTITTPWAAFPNMMCTGFHMDQGGETKDKSRVELKFKQIRLVPIASNLKTPTPQTVQATTSGRAQSMMQTPVSVGQTGGTPTAITTIASGNNPFGLGFLSQ